MPRPLYRPLTRDTFEDAARRRQIRRRERESAWRWALAEQRDGRTWWSPDQAVQAWAVYRLQSHS